MVEEEASGRSATSSVSAETVIPKSLAGHFSVGITMILRLITFMLMSVLIFVIGSIFFCI